MTDATSPPEDNGIERPGWIDRVHDMRFLELFEKYRRRIVHKETGLPFAPRHAQGPLTIERLAFETGAVLRLALKLFFPACALLFALSFYWDTEAGLLKACAVAGMIGFGTNWVAIKMLFWPREPRPVFGQGLIPSQRDQLIEKVADEVLEKLINEELISQKIQEVRVVQRFSQALIDKLRLVVREDEFKADLKRVVLTYAGEMAANPDFRARVAAKAEKSMEEVGGSSLKSWVVKRLKEVWRQPLIGVINKELANLDETIDGALGQMDGVLERLPSTLEKRQEAIDTVLTTMLMGIVREVDLREIILEQLSTVTSDDLEAGFREFSDDKLSFITILGGMFGLVGGPVIIWPLPSIMVILSLIGAAIVVDLALYPFMKSTRWPQQGPGEAETAPTASE
jgi:uncharacterized membrane protein YheB (UPF0754 family)